MVALSGDVLDSQWNSLFCTTDPVTSAPWNRAAGGATTARSSTTRRPAGASWTPRAAASCSRGNTQFRMGEVADEAGVSRSTVYRYFPGRDEVLLGLILMRVDRALGELVRSLAAPDDPVRSLPEMVLARVESVDGRSAERGAVRRREHRRGDRPGEGFGAHRGDAVAPLRAVAGAVEVGGPSLRRSRSRSVVQWLHTATLFLLAPSWRYRPGADKRQFVEQFVVRALVPRRQTITHIV